MLTTLGAIKTFGLSISYWWPQLTTELVYLVCRT